MNDLVLANQQVEAAELERAEQLQAARALEAEQAWSDAQREREVERELGRIVALCYRSATSHQIREHNRCFSL